MTIIACPHCGHQIEVVVPIIDNHVEHHRIALMTQICVLLNGLDNITGTGPLETAQHLQSAHDALEAAARSLRTEGTQ